MNRRSPPTRRTGRVTLADVAQAAGVSSMTVSRVLHGTRAVDPALAARVQAAVAELGYVPDPAARALATQRSNHVAILIPLLSNNVFVELLEAAQRTLRAEGYQTIFGITHYDAREEEQLLREQLLHRPAGLIVTGFERSEETRALIEGSAVPCVHVMEVTRAPGVHSVGFSQLDAGRAVTAHLLAQGARRVAFVATQLDARVMQRADGYRAALRAAGRYDPALEMLRAGPSSYAAGADMLARLMDDAKPDAVFFCNDDLAQGALMAAPRLGIRVPDDVLVAGFNDLPGNEQIQPRLTSIRTPRGDIGAQAAAMLVRLMRGEAVSPTSVQLPWELIVRESSVREA